MPVKRRLGKARKHLDHEELEDLFYGPGSALLCGCGYCGQLTWSNDYERLTPAERATVLAAMRTDWQRQSHTILEAWANRTERDLYIAREFFGDRSRPWAQEHFGDPHAG